MQHDAPSNACDLPRIGHPCGGPWRDRNDLGRLRNARDQYLGFAVGRYLQPAPMLFTRDGHNVFLGDLYRGRAAFLVCGGPSLAGHDLRPLAERGMLTCGVNNVAAVFRPQLWLCVDDPGNFCDVIWRDPAILKFVPQAHFEKPILVRDAHDRLLPSGELVGDMPAVLGYRRNEDFVAAQWLYEDTFNWGNHSRQTDAYGNTGSRSVMYVALRLLFFLGVRRLYLLGCDFRMQHGQQNYAFAQDRSPASVRGNNDTYRILNARLEQLRPHFQREGYEVFNCTPHSGLTVFPYVPYEQAVDAVRRAMPQRVVTAGMYDRAAREEAARAEAQRGKKAARPSSGPIDRGPPQQACPPDVPPLSLVVELPRRSQALFPRSWATWMRYRPWLGELPLLLMHADDVDLQAPELEFLARHPRLQRVPYAAGLTLAQRAALCVHVAARLLMTPWYVQLDPQAVACGAQAWLRGEWFAGQPGEAPPVWIANPWSYTRPADAIARLDYWADGVPSLARFPRLDLPLAPHQSCIHHATISTWCYVGNTAWTQSIAAFTPDALPCPAFGTYVQYVAQRRGEAGRRIAMKAMGWEHHFQSVERTQSRCEAVLAECG